MSIIENHRIENSELVHKSWLKMQTSAAKATEKFGVEFIVWENMSVSTCIYLEAISTELEFYGAATILRDNIHKCYDFDSSLLSTKNFNSL